MRTLALAIGVSVCLGTSAAHALCTTGVECIREQFGTDQTIRNNRIIDRTDAFGDRGRPLNPYLAGRNVAGQARRAGRFDSTLGGRGTGYAADPLRPSEVRPDVRYTPETAAEPFAPGALIPGRVPSELGEADDIAVQPYSPALPATGPTGAAAPRGQVVPGSRTARPAPARRDQNTPQGAADSRYTGPRTSGAYR